MQFTPRKTIGGRAWISIQLATTRQEKALVLWANTSLGFLLHWHHANRQQSGRGSVGVLPLKTLPVLDGKALTPAQLDAAEKLFDTIRNRDLLPIYRLDGDPFGASSTISSGLACSVYLRPCSPRAGRSISCDENSPPSRRSAATSRQKNRPASSERIRPRQVVTIPRAALASGRGEGLPFRTRQARTSQMDSFRPPTTCWPDPPIGDDFHRCRRPGFVPGGPRWVRGRAGARTPAR